MSYDSFEWESGGDLSTGGQYLDQEGTYHFVITSVDTNPQDSNIMFDVTASVCDGTVPNQTDKIQRFRFFGQKGNETEDQKRRFMRTLDRFFVATNLVSREDAIAKKRTKITLQSLVGKQFVAKMVHKEENGTATKYLTAWSDYYHVDDPAVSNVPKLQEALAAVSTKDRWTKAQGEEVAKSRKKQQQQESPVIPNSGTSLDVI